MKLSIKLFISAVITVLVFVFIDTVGVNPKSEADIAAACPSINYSSNVCERFNSTTDIKACEDRQIKLSTCAGIKK